MVLNVLAFTLSRKYKYHISLIEWQYKMLANIPAYLVWCRLGLGYNLHRLPFFPSTRICHILKESLFVHVHNVLPYDNYN
jgi:hypothetical protein